VRIIRKHPIVVTLGVVAALAVAFLVVSRADSEYEAEATVLLLGSSQSDAAGEIVNRNPLDHPSNAARSAARAVADTMDSELLAQRLRDKGLHGSYDVALEPNGGGVILSVRTSGDSASASSDDLDLVLDELSSELESIQREVDPSQVMGIDDQLIKRVDPVLS